MPTYEYECASCGTSFERFESITAKPNGVCPKCRKRAKRRIGAGAGLIFKGSGFYCTDYRSSSGKPHSTRDGSATSAAKKSKSPDTGGTSSTCPKT